MNDKRWCKIKEEKLLKSRKLIHKPLNKKYPSILTWREHKNDEQGDDEKEWILILISNKRHHRHFLCKDIHVCMCVCGRAIAHREARAETQN